MLKINNNFTRNTKVQVVKSCWEPNLPIEKGTIYDLLGLKLPTPCCNGKGFVWCSYTKIRRFLFSNIHYVNRVFSKRRDEKGNTIFTDNYNAQVIIELHYTVKEKSCGKISTVAVSSLTSSCGFWINVSDLVINNNKLMTNIFSIQNLIQIIKFFIGYFLEILFSDWSKTIE